MCVHKRCVRYPRLGFRKEKKENWKACLMFAWYKTITWFISRSHLLQFCYSSEEYCKHCNFSEPPNFIWQLDRNFLMKRSIKMIYKSSSHTVQVSQLGHDRVVSEKFCSIYVVKGVWSWLTELLINTHYYSDFIISHHIQFFFWKVCSRWLRL